MRVFPSDYPQLFQERPLAALLKMQTGRIENAVDQIADDGLLAMPTEDLVEHIYGDAYVPPITIYRKDGIARIPQEIGRYLDENQQTHFLTNGFKFEVAFPFTGARGLFNHRVVDNDRNPPRAQIEDGSPTGNVLVAVFGEDLTEDVIKTEVGKAISKVENYVALQNTQLIPFNENIKSHARAYITNRKDRILEARRIAAALGYAMVRRPDAPPTYITQQLLRVVTRKPLPVVKQGVAYEPEPAIEEADYQHILKVMSGMALMMERSPSTFTKLKEEEIRDHFLLQLNGHYQGSATGETFNRSGKTDIIVRERDRNLFVGECKIWGTEKGITKAINQLLNYLTWRDTKAALVVFVKRQDITGPLQAIKDTVDSHPHKKRGPDKESEACFRFVFGKPEDPAREIILTVMVFHIPSPKGQNNQ